MSLDAIKQISEVERQAEEIVAQARLDAREKALDAQKRVSELRAELISQENQKNQQAAQAAQTAGEAYVLQRVEKAQAEGEALEATALANMPAAISLIVGRVVKS